jgi:hypothetical protein
VDYAVELHRGLGPGLLETVYEVTLARWSVGGFASSGRLASLSSIAARRLTKAFGQI